MSKKQQRVFWPSLVMIVLGLTTVSMLVRNKSAAARAAKPETALVAQHEQPEFKQHIRIWIHGDEVRPKTVHAWPGPALVMVENETPASVSLQIDRVLPNRTQLLGTVNIPGLTKRLRQEVTLGVGEYVFYEASRPTVRGRLIVEPR